MAQTPSEKNTTFDGENGNVADDHYHRWRADIGVMAALGVKHYRMSISWSRIMPTGHPPLNAEGVAFYVGLIKGLLAAGITPLITLYHWDLPLALDKEYGGWLSPRIADDFAVYANACFEAFGPLSKGIIWLTFNEPLSFCQIGYGAGSHAPGRCSDRTKCAAGNSSTEPYICSHQVLRAHGKAMHVYRSKHAATQGGQIGITVNSNNGVAWSNSAADTAARDRYMIWQVGWYADPAFLGDYPAEMKAAVGDRLPAFTDEEKQLFRSNIPDFYGMNHYTSKWVQDCIADGCKPGAGTDADQQAKVSVVGPDGKPIGPQAASPWLQVVPEGIRYNLQYIAQRYATVQPSYKGRGPPIFVTENGCDVPGETQMPLGEALNDTFRVDFYKG